MKKILSILVFSVIFFSCSPEEENNPTPNFPGHGEPGEETATFNLSAEFTEVHSYQIVHLESNNQTFGNQTYNASFGNTEISLVKSEENELIFFIPNVDKGDYTLKLDINNKQGKIDFKVNPTSVNDIDSFIVTEIEVPLLEMSNIVTELKSDLENSEKVVVLLNSAERIVSDLSNKINDLPADQKLEVANFFKMNPFFSTPGNEANSVFQRSPSNENFHCFSQNGNYLKHFSEGLKKWQNMLNLFNQTDSQEMETSGGISTMGAYLVASIIVATQESLLHSCGRPVSIYLKDEEGKSSDFEFSNENFQNYDLKTGIRGLIYSDINDPNEQISKTALSIIDVAENWNNLKTSLNDITGGRTDWFNNWIPENRNYQAIPGILAPPPSAEETLVEGNIEHITIYGLPTGVTAHIESNNQTGFKLKLEAPATILPVNINAKIKFDDGVFHIEHDLKGIIKAPEYNYKLELGYYHADQTITTERILSPGDVITMPNNMNRYIRLTLDGKPTNPTEGGGWYNWTFGDNNTNPNNTKDTIIEDYIIDLPDHIHGGISVKFKLDLILSKKALRMLHENEYNISNFHNGQLSQGPYRILHNSNGTWSSTLLGENPVYTGSYQVFIGVVSREEQCYNRVFNTEVIGVIRTGGYNIHAAPGFIYILEDGNLRVNTTTLGCENLDSGWFIEKIN